MAEQAFEPRKCSAMSKRYDRPCRRWAVQGTTVCWSHGAAAGRRAGGRAEAEAVHTASKLIAEYLKRKPRHLAEVLADAMHTTDAVQQAMRDIVARGDATSDDVAEMTNAARQAAAIGVAIHRQGLLERIVVAQELAITRAFEAWERALDAGGLTREQREAIDDALMAGFEQAERQLALTNGHR